MSGIRFEWDEAKNLTNRRKHGVGFEKTSLIFRDPTRVLLMDRFVDGEQRWHALGFVSEPSGGIPLLLVAHASREELESGIFVEVVGIISARKASPKERRDYADENG